MLDRRERGDRRSKNSKDLRDLCVLAVRRRVFFRALQPSDRRSLKASRYTINLTRVPSLSCRWGQAMVQCSSP